MSDTLSSPNRNRIAILCGPQLHHLNTCATLIGAGLQVVGICVADQRKLGLPLKYLWKSAKKKGIVPTVSRVLARAVYQAFNRHQDRIAYEKIFERGRIEATLRAWEDRIHRTCDYSSPATLQWLRNLNPDILVIHTPYWVGKKVRELPKKGIVLGGHPGLTPAYRGSHSAFWAVYFRKPEDVGCTVFLVDSGVDTGDIIAQDKIPVKKGDSFVTLGWKGMARISQLQAEALNRLDGGIPLPRRAVTIPPSSEFDNPRLGEFLRYRLRQQAVR